MIESMKELVDQLKQVAQRAESRLESMVEPAIDTQEDIVAPDASFEVVATSDLLRDPDDDHTKGVFDPEVRGKTDRFLLKLRRPE